MAAEDLSPTRMEAAKAAAREFVEKQPSGISIGVVVFSDGGISVQPPTDNREETLTTIDRLVPRRGTSIGNGILVALNTIAVDAGDPPILNTSDLSQDPAVAPVEAPQGWYPSAVIVLFTDGENNQDPDPAMAAEVAADLGVRVYTVGVGTTAGTDIEVEDMTVHTSLDEAILQCRNSAEPANLAKYTFSLARTFSRFYHDHRILTEQDEVRRGVLIAVTKIIRTQLTTALGILGIKVPEQM